MLKRIALAFCCVLLPGIAAAQTPENYLPSKTQFYLHWDGMSGHQEAFDKTAVGKMMQGETGIFLNEFWKFIKATALNASRKDPRIEKSFKDVTKLISSMHQDGIVFGVEVTQVMPQPKLQAVVVLPKGADEGGTILPLINKLAEETKTKVKNTKVGSRVVHSIDAAPVKFAWWAQGDDAILYLGTVDPAVYAKGVDTKKTGIAKHPLYQKVTGFKEFSTCMRGYFDIGSVLNVASEIRPEVGQIIDELGLKGIKSITFVSGFDGPAERSVVDTDISGPRKGLLALGSSKKMSLKDLPVLPNDVTAFSAGTLNTSKSYDVITKVIEGVVKIFRPDEVDNIKDAIKNFESVAGLDINKDLFGSFGDIMVSYNSPSDGFLGTGAVVAMQIKDGKKLGKTIEKLIKAIPVTPAGEVIIKKKPYHGGEITQISMTGPTSASHILSFGIYKNWFVYASYPQPIKGFILRQQGELPPWKADEALTKVLGEFPEQFNSIQVSDPRPTMQTLMSIAPLLINIGNTLGSISPPFGGGPVIPGFKPFDLDLIPHAQESTRHLFPNVSIGIDDGKRFRTETRGSLLLPF